MRALAGVVALGWLAGCATTGDYTYVTTIATGQRMKFPLVYGRPELAKSGTITVREVGLNRGLDKNSKQVIYYFVYEDTSGATPRAVRVDDVTESKVMTLVDDVKPVMAGNRWAGGTKPLVATDPSLYWLAYLDDSVRVFRFTITAADGHDIVLYQAWLVPGFVKAGVRMALGEKP